MTWPGNTGVNQNERQSTMLGLLDERPHWSVAELAARFDVSDETIRRDVRHLEGLGRVQKTHGGVSLPNHLVEPPYRIRLRQQAEAKQRIAQMAAEFVEPGMTVLLDSGTSAFWVARALHDVRDLSIVTNNIGIAHEVSGRPGQRLFLAGGRIDPIYNAAFGAEAIDYCRGFVPDISFYSMGAIDARGFLDFDPDEAAFKRALVGRARRLVVLADSTKFHQAAALHVADFDEVGDLVTEARPPAPLLERAAAARLAVHVAGTR